MSDAPVTLLLLFTAGALAFQQHALTDDDAASFLQQFDQTGFTLDLRARRLVQFAERDGPVWMSEAEKIHAKMDGKRFFDVTDTPELQADAHIVAFTKNTTYSKPNRMDAVRRVLETLSTDGPVENLKQFTSFRTRHYCSDTGRQSQLWLLEKINEYTQSFASEGMRSAITVEEFRHPWVCGYASSDHASWNRAGYPSSYAFEGKFSSGNRHAHTADDRMDIAPEFSFEHMLHFVKLAAVISVELGGSD